MVAYVILRLMLIQTYWRSRSTTLRLVAHAATGISFVAPKETKGAKIKVKTSGEPLAHPRQNPQRYALTPSPAFRSLHCVQSTKIAHS